MLLQKNSPEDDKKQNIGGHVQQWRCGCLMSQSSMRVSDVTRRDWYQTSSTKTLKRSAHRKRNEMKSRVSARIHGDLWLWQRICYLAAWKRRKGEKKLVQLALMPIPHDVYPVKRHHNVAAAVLWQKFRRHLSSHIAASRHWLTMCGRMC